MFWVLVCMTAAGAFGMGLALAQLRQAEEGGAPLARGRAPARLPGPEPEPDDVMGELITLKEGDVVLHLEAELVVETVERFTVDGKRLLVARLLSPEDQVLVVTDEGTPVATQCHPVPSAGVSVPPPEQFTLDGMAWRRRRRTETRDGPRACTVHRYEGPDGHVVWGLQQGGQLELLRGTLLAPSAVNVLRGPG